MSYGCQPLADAYFFLQQLPHPAPAWACQFRCEKLFCAQKEGRTPTQRVFFLCKSGHGVPLSHRDKKIIAFAKALSNLREFYGESPQTVWRREKMEKKKISCCNSKEMH